VAELCQKVTLLVVTAAILESGARNVRTSGLSRKIELVGADITDLSRFSDGSFSFVLCVGDAISYALDCTFSPAQGSGVPLVPSRLPELVSLSPCAG
jgi:hypothetical protein